MRCPVHVRRSVASCHGSVDILNFQRTDSGMSILFLFTPVAKARRLKALAYSLFGLSWRTSISTGNSRRHPYRAKKPPIWKFTVARNTALSPLVQRPLFCLSSSEKTAFVAQFQVSLEYHKSVIFSLSRTQRSGGAVGTNFN